MYPASHDVATNSPSCENAIEIIGDLVTTVIKTPLRNLVSERIMDVLATRNSPQTDPILRIPKINQRVRPTRREIPPAFINSDGGALMQLGIEFVQELEGGVI